MPRKGKANMVFAAGNRHIITVWFDESDYNEISRLASENQVPRSMVIRFMVREALRSNAEAEKKGKK